MAGNRKIDNYILFGLSAVIVSALIIRLFFTVSLYDEVLNIHVSYMTAVMGQRHLVENTKIFLGDVFNLPFVWLFYKLTGGMNGVVLFMRFIYLGINIILAWVFSHVFSAYIGKKNSILFVLVLITYTPFSVFSIWYDSAALFFMLMGQLLFVGAVLQEENSRKGMLYLSGLCHGCMVYAYPLMVGVVAVTFVAGMICIVKRHKQLNTILAYILGGVTIIAVFCAYCTFVGWENIYFFQKNNAANALNGRILQELVVSNAAEVQEAGEAVSNEPNAGIMIVLAQITDFLKPIFLTIYQMVIETVHQQTKTLPITLLLLVQWAVGLKKKGILRLLLLLEIAVTSFWGHTGTGQWATQTAYAYYACWAPLLYCYLEEDRRERGKVLLFLLWLPSLAAYLAVGFTALYMQKASMGLYAGAICTLIFMVFISEGVIVHNRGVAPVVILFVAGLNIILLYCNVYESDRISQCTYRMADGIYKGIWTEPEKAMYYNAEMCIKELELPHGTTICLMEDVFSYTPLLLWGEFYQIGGDIRLIEERLSQGENAEEIYNSQSWADLIVMNEDTYVQCPLAQDGIIDRYYDIIVAEGDMLIFQKR